MTKFRLVRRKRYSAFWFSWEFGSDFSIHPTYQKLQTLNVRGDIDTLNSLIFIGVKCFLCYKRNQWSLFWCSKFSSSHSNNSRNYCCIVFPYLWKSLKPVEISAWRCIYETLKYWNPHWTKYKRRKKNIVFELAWTDNLKKIIATVFKFQLRFKYGGWWWAGGGCRLCWPGRANYGQQYFVDILPNLILWSEL